MRSQEYTCPYCGKKFFSNEPPTRCHGCGNDMATSPSQIFTKEGESFQGLFVGEEIKKFARYQIIEELGRGGMGVVYKAQDSQLKRIVALKILIKGSSAKQADLERFYREARATARLKHPYIVMVLDVGNEQGQPFFAMEFLEGKSLNKCSLSIKQAVNVMTKICQGVQYAHECGIIHRDLKPENIIIDKNFEPKIMDFGLAKVTEESKQLSKTGMIMGTLQYMSPEQADGQVRAIDERSDTYSLGATLYKLLTGKPPFQSKSTAKILHQVLNKRPVPPSKTKPQISKSLDNICLKAMAKKKENRYQTARQMAEDLINFSKGKKTNRGKSIYAFCFLGILVLGILIVLILPGKSSSKKEFKKTVSLNKKTTSLLSLYQKTISSSSLSYWGYLSQLEKKVVSSKEVSDKSSVLLQAIYALNNSQFKKAWQICEKIAKETPTLLYVRGKTRIHIGDWERGFVDLQKAVKQLPKSNKVQNFFYHLGANNWSFVHHKVLSLQKLPESRNSLLLQAIGKQALLEVEPRYQGSLAKLWLRLADKYKFPGACLYFAKMQLLSRLSHKQKLFTHSLAMSKLEKNKRIAVWQKIQKQKNNIPEPLFLLYKANLYPEQDDVLGTIIEKFRNFTPAYLALGKRCWLQKKNNRAINYLKKAIDLQGKNQINLFYLGAVYLDSDFKRSFSLFSEYLKEFYKTPRSYASIARAFQIYMFKASTLQKQGKKKEALHYLRIGLDLNFGFTNPVRDVVEFYYSQGEYYKALKEGYEYNKNLITSNGKVGKISIPLLAQKALAKNQHDIQREKDQKRLAVIYARRSFIDILVRKKPVDWIQKSMATFATDKGYFIQGHIYYIVKKYESALKFYKMTVKKNPKFHWGYQAILRCYEKLPMQTNFREFYRLRKEISGFFINYPDLQYMDGINQSIQNILLPFLRTKDSQFLKDIAEFWLKMANFNKSNGRYSKCWSYTEIGGIYQRLGEIEKAQKLYDKAVWLAPYYFYNYLHRARFFQKIGKKKRALMDYQFALFLKQDTSKGDNTYINKEIEKIKLELKE